MVMCFHVRPKALGKSLPEAMGKTGAHAVYSQLPVLGKQGKEDSGTSRTHKKDA